MSWTFQSVAILGSGAIGLYYGGRLAAAGEDVRFLVRGDFESISRHGLEVESIHGDFDLPALKVYQAPAEIGPVDLVIVAWKTTSNSQLASLLPPLLHERTQVLTLQNGLGNCESLAEIVGPQRVLGGLCFVCINRVAPGRIVHSGGGRVSLGEWENGEPGRAEELARRFQLAKIEGIATQSLQKSQWEKLIWNIPFNGLSVAEGGVTTDVLLADPATESLIRKMMQEVVQAAHAQGLDLAEALIDWNVERTRPMGAYRTSSMIDFVEGREVEVTPIWEEPLRRARQMGIAMPETEWLLQRIRASLAGRR